MTWLLVLAAAAAALVAAVLAAAYYGAGLLINPPAMSPMTHFPEQHGLPHEKVAFSTSDGLVLSGWFVPSPAGLEKTLVICHGWGDNKGEILAQTLFLNRAEGFNLLYYDFRGHGESARSLVTMGKLELLDFAAAVAYLRLSRPRCAANLGVFGVSMGAAVAAMALASHPELKAAVVESPFADFREVGGRWAWMKFRVPFFPVITLMMAIARLRSGHADIDTYSPKDFLPKAKVPLLMIAGERDELMPPEDVLRLFAAAREPKEFWVVRGAVHGKCREAAPAEYEARVGAFLRTRLQG